MTPAPEAPARQIRLTATEAEVLDRLRQGMSGVGSGPPAFLK
jgi:DNA-binding CsgD family transcriptional regulator